MKNLKVLYYVGNRSTSVNIPELQSSYSIDNSEFERTLGADFLNNGENYKNLKHLLGLESDIEIELCVGSQYNYLVYRLLDHYSYYVVREGAELPENAIDVARYVYCYQSSSTLYGIVDTVYDYCMKNNQPLKWVEIDA